ncbi:MAG: hypothetical protein OXN96_04250 [Bryobacterales bacterium]|nr:hypothetical protein [Bryobacterales bacterium]
MSTKQGSSLSFTILLALVALALAGCGGGETAPAPPPPAPPPPPPFVPQNVVIDLGSSGEQLTLQTTEAGGFTRNGEAFASGATVEAAGNTYRLTLASGTWTAAYEAPNPWAVSLGRSGEALLITRREDGLYEGNGMVFESGGVVTAANGNQYRLTFADDRWTSAYLPPEPVPVGLGRSGEVALVTRTEGGSYQVGGQTIVSGSIVQSSTGATYRLMMQDGAWTATFEPPPPVVVSLPGSTQTVLLQLGEDGNYTRNGQPFASGTEITVGGEAFLLTLQNGRWTAISQAPVLQMVTLGTSAVTLTLQRGPDGGWTEDGATVRNGDVRRVGNNRYRLLLEDGEWSAEYLRSTIPVDGAGGLIILFQEENGDLTYNGEVVRDGSVITQDGRTYELLELSDGTWLATPGAPPPASGDQTVSLPGSGRSITLTRRDDGSYTYENAAVTDGRVIRVSGVDYRLNRNARGVWSATAVTAGPVNPGTVGGPTQTDEVDTFTESRFGAADDNPYGVRFRRRGRSDVTTRGTSMIPARFTTDTTQYPDVNGERPADLPDFPVYGLVGRGLVSQERTYAETAKAKLEEIISVIQLNKPLYAAEDVDPDDHIGSDGDNGLWDDAETAVARIFGQTKADNPLGGNPAGSRVDADEVDAIIAALQDAISGLSDVEVFEREFEDAIAEKNTAGSTDFDAEDFFTGMMSKIRFGSTNGTRFGVYAYRRKHAGGDAANALQHAAQAGTDIEWDTGVIAYTPLDGPSSGDIPSRGQARFQGDTVAIDDVSDVNSPVLYAGKIELIASFAKGEVNGTVTALKDEGGNAWEFESTRSFRDEVVKSITLPTASKTGVDAAHHGFYEATVVEDTNEATLAFDRNLRDEADSTGVLFEVQLLDEATEALGVWQAFDLKGSFGAPRSGSVTKPTLPSFPDRGDGVETDSRVVYIGTTSSPEAISDDEEDNTFKLTRANLGSPPGDFGANVDEDGRLSYTLTSLYSAGTRTVRGPTFAANARTLISRWMTELRKSTVDPTNIDSSFQSNAEAALNQIGSGFVPTWSGDWDGDGDTGDEADWLRVLSDLDAALGSRTRFKAEQETGEALAGLSYTDQQIDTLIATRNLDFTIRMDRTRYTRFGVWSQKAPDLATDSIADTPDAIDTGTLAYSFLKREGGLGLTFIADYRGTTVAVDEDNGNLYRGTIDLTVNWNDDGLGGGALTSSVTDLRGVSGTSAYFRHDDKDVRTIFFSGVTVGTNGAFDASNAAVDIGYRNGQQEAGVSAAGNFTGVFVGDSHNEGPLGVLGRWRIPEVNFQGSFGADLQP